MGSDRKKILWLASWYPNRYDPFDGDFVQRHARAAALYNDIHVIVVKEGESVEEVETDWTYDSGLTEQIIYFNPRSGLLRNVRKLLKWRKIYLSAVKDYIRKFGNPDLVHVHVPWKAGLIALELKKRYGLQFLITEHWTIYNDGKPSSYDKWAFTEKLLLRWIYKGTLRVVTVSRNLGVLLKDIFKVNLIDVINNAVDTDLFFYQDEVASEEFHFIHVSTLTKQKNVIGLITAYVQLKSSLNIPCKLSIVGPYSKDMEKFIANQTNDNSINLLGLKTYSEVSELVRGSDCMVLFSNYENSPCVIVESLCCGKPVIATNVGGVNELINESNGILVNPDKTEELICSMKQMLQHYSLYNNKVIASDAQKKFGYKPIGEKFNTVYNSRFLDS